MIRLQYICLITQSNALPDRVHSSEMGKVFQPLVIISGPEEGMGGFYALIIMSVFPLTYWMFRKKGEWDFFQATFLD